MTRQPKVKAMAYDYVRRAYNVDPIVGNPVRHTVTNGYGSIPKEDPSQAHYVQVKFEGKSFALPCHPTELEYIVRDDRVAVVA